MQVGRVRERLATGPDLASRERGTYWFAALTHIAISGLSAGLGVIPHDTEFSVRKVTGLLLMPQKAVTSTSSCSHWAVQDCSAQFTRTIRVCEAGPGGP
jgi:hypothetical protein